MVDITEVCKRWVPHTNVHIPHGIHAGSLSFIDCQSFCENDYSWQCIGINWADSRTAYGPYDCIFVTRESLRIIHGARGFTYFYLNRNCPIGRYVCSVSSFTLDITVYYSDVCLLIHFISLLATNCQTHSLMYRRYTKQITITPVSIVTFISFLYNASSQTQLQLMLQ